MSMDFVKGVISIISSLWDLLGVLARHIGYLRNFEDNLKSLKDETDELRAIREDVMIKLDVAGRLPQNRCTNRGKWWLGSTEALESDADDLQRCLLERRNTGYYFTVWESYKLGKRVAEKMDDEGKLNTRKAYFENVSTKAVPKPVNVIPCSPIKAECSALKKVESCVGEVDVGIIGTWSIAGVEKTVPKPVNVITSPPIDVERLAWKEAWDLFREKVGEDTMNSHPEISELAEIVAEECAGLPVALITIGRAMASKKTPEEWKNAITDLRKLAFDFPGMEDKVLPLLKFSYDNLDDDRIRSCFLYCSLHPRDFSIKKDELIDYWVGEGFLDECDDLDAARIKGHYIIGRLNAACLLEYGDNPETEVKMHRVVRQLALWIASEYGYWENRNKFLVLASARLTQAPVLDEWKEATRMSLMYNHLEALMENPTSPNLLTLMLQHNWNLNKISDTFFEFMPLLRILDLRYTRLEELPTGIEKLVKLRHLNLSGTKLEELPAGIGKLVQLRHLNLSSTRLQKLPVEIGELVELEHLNLAYTPLKELPMRIGKLVGLQHLCLVGAKIVSLPEELVNLVKLKHLNLQCTTKLTKVPHKVIARLSRLQVLNLYRSNYTYWKVEYSDDDLLAKLEGLKQLNEIGITISDVNALNRFAGSQVLTKCTRYLSIMDCNALTSFKLSSTVGNLKRLQDLMVSGCSKLEELIVDAEAKGDDNYWLLPRLEELFLCFLDKLKTISMPHICLQNLRVININRCQELKNVSWVIHLRNLVEIRLMHCDGMEEVMGDEADVVAQDLIPLPKLKWFFLLYLPELKSIHRHALAIPSLQYMSVNDCPKLKKLPFSPDGSTNSRLQINGSKRWWDGLDWDDERVKSTLLPYFNEVEDSK